jgi:hypothetical protein
MRYYKNTFIRITSMKEVSAMFEETEEGNDTETGGDTGGDMGGDTGGDMGGGDDTMGGDDTAGGDAPA